MHPGLVIAQKYRLNQLIGSGGMAEVWSATNVFTERLFAIKFLRSNTSRNPESAARFMKEARVSARIDHPNVIDIIDVGQAADGTLFLVMELLTGVPLETALKRQRPPMTLHEFTFVLVEVASALAAAHRAGVVHRDLKPTNIFLHRGKSGQTVPKVLDFGVSKLLEDDPNHGLTIEGTVLGSPLYMSPEQARGESSVNHTTDIFAFGAILFEALVGYRAYDSPNFNALIVNLATKAPKNIDEHAPQMPECLRAIVRLCLEPDRARRISSFDAVASMLRSALDDLETSNLRLPVPAPSADDANATHAMPAMGAVVARAHDRPSVPPHSVPGLSGEWQRTPNTSYASIAPMVSPPGSRAVPWTLATVGAVAAAVVVLGIGVGAALAFGRVRAASRPEPTRPASALVTVDATPKNLPAGHARLTIARQSGACHVQVDGHPVGATPLEAVDVMSGRHTVACDGGGTERGQVDVVATEGTTTKIVFPPPP